MNLGVVAIGRNEGERLRRCLDSLVRDNRPVVYVDSGSTDGSVAYARSVGADVVELDMSVPFTAARARNAGFERLIEKHGEVELVQFVDGDCEMLDAWFAHAVETFEREDDVAVVCGRLRELYPDETVYNRLADMEWNTPTGEVEASGGIFVIRARAFREVGRFNESIIAGEEPELCARLRAGGWRILRLPHDMGYHDAAITRFSQWWRRTVRGGHAFIEGYLLHRDTPQAYWGKLVRSNWFWGLGFPLAVLAAAWPTGGWSLLLLLAYPLMMAKIARYRMRSMNDPLSHALTYGCFMMIGKPAGAWGQLKYLLNRVRGRQTRIIEYKTAN